MDQPKKRFFEPITPIPVTKKFRNEDLASGSDLNMLFPTLEDGQQQPVTFAEDRQQLTDTTTEFTESIFNKNVSSDVERIFLL